jgi:hypothetical protein
LVIPLPISSDLLRININQSGVPDTIINPQGSGPKQ